MSSVNPNSLCNLARIDTSNDSDWSDLEGSLGSSHSQRRSNKHTIEVIPSTPNGGYLADDEVASLREMDSLVVPSSTESIEEPFASLVISITNLEGTTQTAEEWETTLQDTTTNSTTKAFDTHCNITDTTNSNTSVAINNKKKKKTAGLKNLTASKPNIRPRVSAFDKENLAPIPLRHCIGHRRVSFNNLPSPKDLEDMQEQGVEMSYTTTRTSKKSTKQTRPKKKWSHRRPKLLNATTGFR